MIPDCCPRFPKYQLRPPVQVPKPPDLFLAAFVIWLYVVNTKLCGILKIWGPDCAIYSKGSFNNDGQSFNLHTTAVISTLPHQSATEVKWVFFLQGLGSVCHRVHGGLACWQTREGRVFRVRSKVHQNTVVFLAICCCAYQ